MPIPTKIVKICVIDEEIVRNYTLNLNKFFLMVFVLFDY